MYKLHLRFTVIMGFLYFLVVFSEGSDDKEKCDAPLLEDKQSVPDSAFSAPHFALNGGKYFYPHLARMKNPDDAKEFMAWCPSINESITVEPYLQIEFNVTKILTIVDTKGRFASNQGKEFTPYYYIKYQRENTSEWYDYQEYSDNSDPKYRIASRIKGNDDVKTRIPVLMRPRIIAKRFRIYPVKERISHFGTESHKICLRIELYGCDYKSSVMEYRMSERKASILGSLPLHYTDKPYDGILTNQHQWSGGIGALVDNIVYRSVDARDGTNNQAEMERGDNVVSWCDPNKNADPIKLLFRFDCIRNFTEIHIHSMNAHIFHNSVFRLAVIDFGVTDSDFQHENQVNYTYRSNEFATERWIIIRLQKNSTAIGMFVQILLFFDKPCIYLSEIRFVSTPVSDAIFNQLKSKVIPTDKVKTQSPDHTDRTAKGLLIVTDKLSPMDDDTFVKDLTRITIVVGSLLGVIVLCGTIGCIACVMLRRKKRQKKKHYKQEALHQQRQQIQNYTAATQSYPVHSNDAGYPPVPTLNLMNKALQDNSIYTSLASEEYAGGSFCGVNNNMTTPSAPLLRLGGECDNMARGPGSDVTYATANGSLTYCNGAGYSQTANGISHKHSAGKGDKHNSSKRKGVLKRFAQRMFSSGNHVNGNNSCGEYASATLVSDAFPPPYQTYNPSHHMLINPASYLHSTAPQLQVTANPLSDSHWALYHPSNALIQGLHIKSSQESPSISMRPAAFYYHRPSGAALLTAPSITRFPSDVSIQAGSGSTPFTMTTNTDHDSPSLHMAQSDNNNLSCIPLIPISQLTFLEILGTIGHFGEVHLAELRTNQHTDGMNSYSSSLSSNSMYVTRHKKRPSCSSEDRAAAESGDEEITPNVIGGNKKGAAVMASPRCIQQAYHAGGQSSSQLVAVKLLRSDANEQSRTNFFSEVTVLSRLTDPNIVKVIGLCVTDATNSLQSPTSSGNNNKVIAGVITEYLKFGDLHQFLQGHYPPTGLFSEFNTTSGTSCSNQAAANYLRSKGAPQSNSKTLSYGALIYIAGQIASGMRYLESMNIIHRDLACRNCLVGKHYSIKISDFGMCRRLHNSDYYRFDDRVVLPIRWMAWESLLMGKFTSRSDVWSFGVTLWEILTFCREQPYSNLTDAEVIANCNFIYNDDCQSVTILPCPPYCSKEIYDLMCECWNKKETCRPSFQEIHMFLERKSFGFTPPPDPGENASIAHASNTGNDADNNDSNNNSDILVSYPNNVNNVNNVNNNKLDRALFIKSPVSIIDNSCCT